MIENSITQQDIHALQAQIKQLVNKYPKEMIKYIFSYEKEKGLLNYE